MDDFEKKVLAQLDDDAPGARTNALELLREHMKKQTPPHTFREWVGDLEEAAKNKADADALRQGNAQLTTDLAQWKSAVATWQKEVDRLKRQLALSQGIDWLRLHGRRLAAVVVLPVLGLVAYLAYQHYSWPFEVDEGLRRVAAQSAKDSSADWQDGCGQAAVHKIAGKFYWALLCGDTDTRAHTTAAGVPVGMHCVHVYAAKAEPDFGQYVKANPYRFGWWIKWPERAHECVSFPLKEAQR